MILGKLLLLHLIDIKKASVTPKPLHCTNYISMTALYHLDSDLNILYEIHFHMIFFSNRNAIISWKNIINIYKTCIYQIFVTA